MVAVPSQMTWLVGQRLTDTALNDDIRDAVNFLLNPPRVQVYDVTTATNIPDDSVASGTYYPISFGSETGPLGFDSDGVHSIVSQKSRLTIVTPGTYLVSGLYTAAANATGYRWARWLVNSTNYGPHVRMPANSGVETTVAAPTLQIVCAAGDWIELAARQSSGGTLATGIASPAYCMASALWIAA